MPKATAVAAAVMIMIKIWSLFSSCFSSVDKHSSLILTLTLADRNSQFNYHATQACVDEVEFKRNYCLVAIIFLLTS